MPACPFNALLSVRKMEGGKELERFSEMEGYYKEDQRIKNMAHVQSVFQAFESEGQTDCQI